MRSVEAATFTLTRVPSSSVIRTVRKFGSKRLFVLLFAWLTLLPTIGDFPLKKHLRAIVFTFEIRFKKVAILVIFCRNFA